MPENAMPFDFGDKQRMSVFYMFSESFRYKTGQALANSDSANDVASFAADIGEENLCGF